MTITIKPTALRGSITPPPSKSYAHRALIAAALSHGESKLRNIELSKDITATINCLKSIGADIKIDGKEASVNGIEKIPEKAVLDCHESGSTLRFMIPVSAALGINSVFIGSGKLPTRPIDTYKRELAENGINFSFENDLSLPLEISGKLTSGRFSVEGDISSQYITGLLFALPLSGGEIKVTSPLQSRGYVDITIDVLSNFGVAVTQNNDAYTASGGYKPTDYYVEEDYSQAAFWYACDGVTVENMNPDSIQTDKNCIEILSKIKTEMISEIDISQIPDLLPILAVTAAAFNKKVTFTNAKRLIIKESNRLESTAEMIRNLGGKAEFTADSLTVFGVGRLRGGQVFGCNDHRIVMSAAVAAESCKEDVIITDAEAVNKSYPTFWNEYKKLGGEIIEN
jgi:3-phosphoshikimate 1-carboxyvinyltransferase